MTSSKLLIVSGVTVIVSLTVSLLPGQEVAAQLLSTPAWNQETDSLRQELRQVSQLLQGQQARLDEQTRRMEQLERELAASRELADRSAVQPIPPVLPESSSARLVLASETLGLAPPSVDCIPGVPCDGQCESCLGSLRDPCGPKIRFGGQYRVMFNASNFGFHDVSITDSQEDRTFFNQRFRTWLTVNPNEHVEGYLQAEMGHIGWGENYDFPKTYVGPRFPGADDRVGVELRYGYLGYKNDRIGRWRAGIQPWQDSFGQTLASSDWDFSVGGISWATTLGDADVLFGAFNLFEGNVDELDDATLFTWDLDWHLSDDHGFGLSVYYLPDNGDYSYPTAAAYDSAWDVWLGARVSTLVGRLPINGFAIYNSGQRNELAGPDFTHDGVALKLETGPVGFGSGNLRFQTLYSTGDKNPGDNHSEEFRTVAQSARDNFGSQGYWSYLVITSPHGPSDVNDLGVSLQNRGLGLFTVQAMYDYPISRRLSGASVAGWLSADQINPTSGSREVGTELAQLFTLDLGGGLAVDFGAAVLFTGDFYRTAPAAAGPDDIWEAFTRVQLEF